MKTSNAELLEMIRQNKRKEILLWLQTPQSSLLLSKCIDAGMTPLEVASPEMLLPCGAKVCRQLSRFLLQIAHRIEKMKAKCFEDYRAARALQELAVKENRKTLQHILATPATL